MKAEIAIVWLLVSAGASFGVNLTGNWVVAAPTGDGFVQRTWFNLSQDASRITGSIRVRQFYYTIAGSTGGPDGFTLIGTMKDGDSERRSTWEGKLAGDELRIA